MGVEFYLLPKTSVGADPEIARNWLDSENRRFGEIPRSLDSAAETRKRRLADLLLRMKPGIEEFSIGYEKIAEYERISADEARLKYRHIEINDPSAQFIFYDQYVAIGVGSKIDLDELDAILAALSSEGGFVLFDPQSNVVVDLTIESIS